MSQDSEKFFLPVPEKKLLARVNVPSVDDLKRMVKEDPRSIYKAILMCLMDDHDKICRADVKGKQVLLESDKQRLKEFYGIDVDASALETDLSVGFGRVVDWFQDLVTNVLGEDLFPPSTAEVDLSLSGGMVTDSGGVEQLMQPVVVHHDAIEKNALSGLEKGEFVADKYLTDRLESIQKRTKHGEIEGLEWTKAVMNGVQYLHKKLTE